jgi:hypothetical protein
MLMWWKTGTTVALTVLIGAATCRAAEPARGNAGDTMTLKLTKGNDGDVEDAHWRHYRHRAYYFNYYTPYAYSYYYPRYYYRPYVYYYPPPVFYYSTPAYYYPISLSATLATTLANVQPDRATLSTQAQTTQPPPRPPQEDAVGYPYNGGPNAPPPMPKEEAKPMKTPPVNSVPLEGRSVSLPAAKPKYTYAGYGEEEKTTKKDDRTVSSKKEPAKK